MKLSKPSINLDDLNSFLPISNLTFLSKIRCIERIATKKLTVHADQQSIVSMIGHVMYNVLSGRRRPACSFGTRPDTRQ